MKSVLAMLIGSRSKSDAVDNSAANHTNNNDVVKRLLSTIIHTINGDLDSQLINTATSIENINKQIRIFQSENRLEMELLIEALTSNILDQTRSNNNYELSNAIVLASLKKLTTKRETIKEINDSLIDFLICFNKYSNNAVEKYEDVFLEVFSTPLANAKRNEIVVDLPWVRMAIGTIISLASNANVKKIILKFPKDKIIDSDTQLSSLIGAIRGSSIEVLDFTHARFSAQALVALIQALSVEMGSLRKIVFDEKMYGTDENKKIYEACLVLRSYRLLNRNKKTIKDSLCKFIETCNVHLTDSYKLYMTEMNDLRDKLFEVSNGLDCFRFYGLAYDLYLKLPIHTEPKELFTKFKDALAREEFPEPSEFSEFKNLLKLEELPSYEELSKYNKLLPENYKQFKALRKFKKLFTFIELQENFIILFYYKLIKELFGIVFEYQFIKHPSYNDVVTKLMSIFALIKIQPEALPMAARAIESATFYPEHEMVVTEIFKLIVLDAIPSKGNSNFVYNTFCNQLVKEIAVCKNLYTLRNIIFNAANMNTGSPLSHVLGAYCQLLDRVKEVPTSAFTNSNN